jgi:hypothetical protein
MRKDNDEALNHLSRLLPGIPLAYLRKVPVTGI